MSDKQIEELARNLNPTDLKELELKICDLEKSTEEFSKILIVNLISNFILALAIFLTLFIKNWKYTKG